MEIDYDDPDAVANDTRTMSEKIADGLSKCLFIAKDARACVVALEMEDGTTWVFRQGSLPAQLGLVQGLQIEAEKRWMDVADEGGEDDGQ